VEKRNNEELIVVIDNNVFISYFWGGTTIGTIFDALYDGIFQPIVSEKILVELEAVGERLKFRKHFTWSSFKEACDMYQSIAIHVTPHRKIFTCRDISDNMFLECAMEGNAHFLITGDKDLLELDQFERTAIVTPAAFIHKVL
jgi:putative PIN family toxin of toxin-antitoxin system